MKDLTKGSVFKTLLSFALPLVAGNIFQLLYSFTDSLIVGKILGVKELAGMASGFSIMIARYFGAKDKENLKKTIVHSLFSPVF